MPDCFICKDILKARANGSEVPVVFENTLFEGLKEYFFRETEKSLSTSLTTTECKNKLMSFMCAVFNNHSCDPNNPVTVSPNGDECREIRDELCVLEWELLKRSISQLPGADQFRIPNCSELDGEVDNETTALQCVDQFGEFCGFFCLPLCEDFSQNSDGSILLQDVLFIFAAVCSLVGGIIVIIISIYRRSSM